MKKIVCYLQGKEVIFHGSLMLILLYVPHAGHLFVQLEHLDMTFYGVTVLNWLYGIALAGAIEFLILVFIVNGYRNTGKFYAVVSFFLNVFYYDYWFIAVHAPTAENIKIAVISLFICLTHCLAVWQLSELFYTRLKHDEDQDTAHICPQCQAGPFPSKRSLDGHMAKAHKARQEKAKKHINHAEPQQALPPAAPSVEGASHVFATLKRLETSDRNNRKSLRLRFNYGKTQHKTRRQKNRPGKHPAHRRRACACYAACRGRKPKPRQLDTTKSIYRKIPEDQSLAAGCRRLPRAAPHRREPQSGHA